MREAASKHSDPGTLLRHFGCPAKLQRALSSLTLNKIYIHLFALLTLFIAYTLLARPSPTPPSQDVEMANTVIHPEVEANAG